MEEKPHRKNCSLSRGSPPAYYAGGGAVLARPAVVEQIMITLVQYVDTAMVGSLGSAATAAVGLTASTTWLFNGFLNACLRGLFLCRWPSIWAQAAKPKRKKSPGRRFASSGFSAPP